MTPFETLCTGLALSVALGASASAQHADHAAHAEGMRHDQTMDHAAMVHSPAPGRALPTEPGQSAFAAIAEIVAMLSADPSTDWSRVDIDGLRAHLRDMDLVTLRSTVETAALGDGARFEVSGDGDVAESVRRMTLAHAPFLESEGPWSVEATSTETGAVLTVRTADPATTVKIQALGFYGLMALGAHHQPHHLAMARGDGASVHKH